MESNKQEESNLLKYNPVAKVASGGSWMSKHVSPLFMGTPLEGNKFGKAMADNDGDYEKAKASMAPQMNKAAAYMKEDPQENLKKPYKKTKRAAQNRGDIINTPEQIAKIKADRAAKKKASEEKKKKNK
tara:strand:- start:260 stop:646 length:387 start_codon:yes stop_codon:yes gene_type:complete